jgi:hypothetical protein
MIVTRLHSRPVSVVVLRAIKGHPKRVRTSTAGIRCLEGGARLLFRDSGDVPGEFSRLVNDKDSMFLDRVRQGGARCDGVLFGRS